MLAFAQMPLASSELVTLSIKDGCEITRLHARMVEAIPIMHRVYQSFGFDLTFTSGNDGEHKEGSLHYADPLRALDSRTWADDKGTQMGKISHLNISTSTFYCATMRMPHHDN